MIFAYSVILLFRGIKAPRKINNGLKSGRLYRAGTGYTILPAVEGIILRMLRALKKNLYKKPKKAKKKVV